MVEVCGVIVALVCGGRLCGDCGFGVWWKYVGSDCGFGVWWKCVGVIVVLVCEHAQHSCWGQPGRL